MFLIVFTTQGRGGGLLPTPVYLYSLYVCTVFFATLQSGAMVHDPCNVSKSATFHVEHWHVASVISGLAYIPKSSEGFEFRYHYA